MNFIAEKEPFSLFDSPASVFVRKHLVAAISRKICRVYNKGAIVFPLYRKELGAKILRNLFEPLLPQSFLKDAEGVMRRRLAARESTETSQTSVIAKFFGQLSLRARFPLGNQKQSFKQIHRVKPFSSDGGFRNKASDEREVDRREGFHQRVVFGDLLGHNPISKTELVSYDEVSLKEVFKNHCTIYLFNYQYVS